jgi:hypothetical protein
MMDLFGTEATHVLARQFALLTILARAHGAKRLGVRLAVTGSLLDIALREALAITMLPAT